MSNSARTSSPDSAELPIPRSRRSTALRRRRITNSRSRATGASPRMTVRRRSACRKRNSASSPPGAAARGCRGSSASARRSTSSSAARQFPRRHALKLGMVDEVVPRALPRSTRRASSSCAATSAQRRAFRAGECRGRRRSCATRAPSDVMRETRGHYPARRQGAARSSSPARHVRPHDSLARRTRGDQRTRPPRGPRGISSAFSSLQERAEKLHAGATGAPKIERVAVIGAGVMGAGIAQWLATRGLRVILRDIDPMRVAAGMGRVAEDSTPRRSRRRSLIDTAGPRTRSTASRSR